MLVPGILQTLLTVSGLYLLTCEVTGKHLAANIACVLFFLNGGFGFIYYLDGAAADAGVFTGMMPMMHTHSFFAAELCLILWCIADFIRTDRKEKGR